MDIDQSNIGMTESVDLSSCDREPIHKLGRVQSFGALVAVSSDWLVSHASANIERFLGASAEELLGSPLRETVRDDAFEDIRKRLAGLGTQDATERLFGLRLVEGGAPVDVAMHLSGSQIVLEFEKSEGESRKDLHATVYPMISRLSQAKDVEELCRLAARQLRALTGFDRVMVYGFASDGSGTVLAEHHRSGMEPYLGLRYPASDIPKQARALYKRSLLRIISDVKDDGFPVLPERAPEEGTLDLSLSATRAVSPIHREYLGNMGVEASMSVSILKRGQLWGLFACHHQSPRVLSYELRSAAELFGQLFAFVLDQKEADQERRDYDRARTLHDQLMMQIAEGSSISENFETMAEAIGQVIPHDGAVMLVDGEFRSLGQTPTREEFLGLARHLNTSAASRVRHTDRIQADYPPAEAFMERAAGMLVLPVSRTPRDYIVFFRREVAKDVKWAGNPEKPVEVGPNGIRLTPRKSFEAWQQTVHGTSLPWLPTEVRAAEALRVTLLEVVLRITDVHIKEQQKAQERQELLIAELNHRVRNILGLIRSLVQQSRGDSTDVTQFTEIVGGRIQALARAHDQITKELWEPASLRGLILTEAEAYFDQKASRLTIKGPDALIEPKAFTTLSLVIHELTTNAAKYGALSDSSGTIEVTIAETEDGALQLVWNEVGGPPITDAPRRRGFGTTIIERSVPYELKGKADVSFATGGLKATFMLPPSHVARFTDGAGESGEGPAEEAEATAFEGPVLLVEDNMIIALDAEEFLLDLGAKRVEVAATVDDALNLVGRETFSAAMLDVNLGSETSIAVARELEKRGVPFVFATGYGDGGLTGEPFPDTPVVQKPYDRATIEAAFAQLG